MSSTSAKCRIGFISTASIAKKNYRGLLLAPNCEFVAVASRSLDKAQAWAHAVGASPTVKVYGTYEELIADPDVDALYVPLPTSLHDDVVLKAVAAKKGVLVEKPAAVDFPRLAAMSSAAHGAGVPLWDGLMFIHHDRMALMKADLASPAFGRVLKVVSGFSFFGDASFQATNIRMKASLDALGAVGDLGWYSIRFALWAFDWELPASVTAVAHAWSSEGVPIDVVATMTWADGRSAHFDCSFTTAFRQYCEVAGERGSLRLDDFVISRNHASVEYSVVTDPGLDDSHSNVLGERKVVEVRGCNQEAAMWAAFGAEVLRCKAGGGGAPSTYHPGQALATQLVTDGVMASLRAGGVATVITPPPGAPGAWIASLREPKA